MGNRWRIAVSVLAAGLVTVGVSACTTSETTGEPVDLDATDIESWSRSVLGEHEGISMAGRHSGDAESGGSFHDVEPGWYKLQMACTGGNGMALEVEADGETISNGTTGCNSFTAASSIELLDMASELTVRISNSGEQMLWAIGLAPTSAPAATPQP